jgi:hypothetical protein
MNDWYFFFQSKEIRHLQGLVVFLRIIKYYNLLVGTWVWSKQQESKNACKCASIIHFRKIFISISYPVFQLIYTWGWGCSALCYIRLSWINLITGIWTSYYTRVSPRSSPRFWFNSPTKYYSKINSRSYPWLPCRCTGGTEKCTGGSERCTGGSGKCTGGCTVFLANSTLIFSYLYVEFVSPKRAQYCNLASYTNTLCYIAWAENK